MLAEGYDPTDQDQINAFMLLYNQRLLAQQSFSPPKSANPESQPTHEDGLAMSKKSIMDIVPPSMKQPGISRNQPCPCGSGKKYKKCHG